MLEGPSSPLARLTEHVRDSLYFRKELLLSAQEWRGDAVWYSGTEKHGGMPLRLLYFGGRATESFVARMLFREHREERRMPGLAAWSGVRQLERARSGVDLVLGDVAWPWWHAASAGDFLRAPPFVSHKIPLAGSWDAMEAQFRRRKTTRDDLKRAASHAFTFELTQDAAAIGEFYDSMYVPHAGERHGGNTLVESREAVLHIGRAGALLQVFHERRFVAAGVLYRVADSLRFLWFGMLPGIERRLSDALRAALHFRCMQLGIEIGCRQLDLRDSPPLLDNGILRYKRKLGSRLWHEWHRSRWLVRPNNFGPAVVSAFTHMPLLVATARGTLRGKLLVDREALTMEEIRRLHADHACPGMECLEIHSLRPLPAHVGGAAGASAADAACPLVLFDLSAAAEPLRVFCAA